GHNACHVKRSLLVRSLDIAIRTVSFSPPLFFFTYHAPHRDLHSFPTRRSSDLRAQIRLSPPTSVRLCEPGDRMYSPSRFSFPGRSEEHTSELQSQSNLVCRLLLEKKKKKNKYNYTSNFYKYTLSMFTSIFLTST